MVSLKLRAYWFNASLIEITISKCSCWWSCDDDSTSNTCTSTTIGFWLITCSWTQVVLSDVDDDGFTLDGVISEKSSKWVVICQCACVLTCWYIKLLKIANMSWCDIPSWMINSCWVVMSACTTTSSVKGSILVNMESMEPRWWDVLNVSIDSHFGKWTGTKTEWNGTYIRGVNGHPLGWGLCLLKVNSSSGSIRSWWIRNVASGSFGLSGGLQLATLSTKEVDDWPETLSTGRSCKHCSEESLVKHNKN